MVFTYFDTSASTKRLSQKGTKYQVTKYKKKTEPRFEALLIIAQHIHFFVYP